MRVNRRPEVSMQRREFLTLVAGLPLLAQSGKGPIAEISADVLEDEIRGGFLGRVIGDLNGLEHEMKYIAEPGNVQEYTPALPDGRGPTTTPTSNGPTCSRCRGPRPSCFRIR